MFSAVLVAVGIKLTFGESPARDAGELYADHAVVAADDVFFDTDGSEENLVEFTWSLPPSTSNNFSARRVCVCGL